MEIICSNICTVETTWMKWIAPSVCRRRLEVAGLISYSDSYGVVQVNVCSLSTLAFNKSVGYSRKKYLL